MSNTGQMSIDQNRIIDNFYISKSKHLVGVVLCVKYWKNSEQFHLWVKVLSLSIYMQAG